MKGMDRVQLGETLIDVVLVFRLLIPGIPCWFWIGDCLGLPGCRASAVRFPEPRSRGWFV